MVIREASLLDVLTVSHNMRPLDWKAIHAVVGDVSPDAYACDRFAHPGPTWCIADDDGPIAVGGMHEEGMGIATWWLVATPALGKVSKTLVRLGRHVMQRSLASGEYRRIQAYVLDEWPEAKRLTQLVGMQSEGTLRKVGLNGEDMVLMAIVA